MVILGKENKPFTADEEVNQVKQNIQYYHNNREKIDVGLWNDYLNAEGVPAKIKIRLLNEFKKTWRFKPARQTIIPEYIPNFL